ncbi:MAG: glutathione gamma-glutamylcysteinyltransferase [Phormidesmis sp. RL_2_1]|nr:glutathione gamma-glutamylcysteinyltransferase [Phormidesmis sp. RL_2_1]
MRLSSLFLPSHRALNLLALTSLSLTVHPPHLLAQTLPLPEQLIALNSPAGQNLLRESEAQADFVPLITQYVTQENQAFCGIASMVMVLNSLDLAAPLAPAWNRGYFTQDNLFNAATEAVIPREKIAQQGLTLEELAGILASYPLQVERHHGADVSLEQFRQLIVTNLAEANNFVVVNYLRRAIGQERGGHISPLAAYDADTDQVLILDVSRYKYPPVWVKVEALWNAVNTIDSVSGLTRGIVTVERTTAPHSFRDR